MDLPPEKETNELFYRHEERTQMLKNQEKYKVFREWMTKNGAKIEKVEYPVCFTKSGMLMGIAAATDLKAGDMYIEIPDTLVISRRTILKSEIGPIILKHPELFDKHNEVDLALVIYFFHERLKGQNSFWAPSFNIINCSDLPAFWEEKEIKEFQDKVMIDYIKQYRKQIEEDWRDVLKLLRENQYDEFYPGISDPSQEARLKEEYIWSFNASATRFLQMEFSLKMSSFFPFADCANHLPGETTLYKTLDPDGTVVRHFTEEENIEPWGVPGFEYFYSRPLKKIHDERKKKLYIDPKLKEELEETSWGNLTRFDEATRDNHDEIYRIYTQHSISKNEQIFYNYGRCNNRYWIINYAFIIENNQYDGFPVTVNFTDNDQVAILFKDQQPTQLLNLARRQLKIELKREPSEYEIKERSIKLINDQYEINFGDSATSIDEDKEILKNVSSYRMFMNVVYRLSLKEIVDEHVNNLNNSLSNLSE